jgi:hypothetical protein
VSARDDDVTTASGEQPSPTPTGGSGGASTPNEGVAAATPNEGLTTADLSGATRQDEDTGAPAADGTTGDGSDGGDESAGPLLPEEDSTTFQQRWRDIQVRFVDEPQGAVRDADGLVAEVMQRLAGTFAEERSRLEGEWERGDDVSTEDLRKALQHYRSFFQRLLSA